MEVKQTPSAEEGRAVKRNWFVELWDCKFIQGVCGFWCRLTGGWLLLCAGVEGEGAPQHAELARFPPRNPNGGGNGAVKREL